MTKVLIKCRSHDHSKSFMYCSCESTMHMVYMNCIQSELRLKSLRQEYVRQVKCGWTSPLPT